MSRTLGLSLAGAGLLAVATAPVLSYAVVPAFEQLPDDTDVVRAYEGTFDRLLDPTALASGGDALRSGVPAGLERAVQVLDTDGDDALVSERGVVLVGGQPVASSDATYAVDRGDLGAGDASAFPDADLVAQEGQTISWPIGAERQDYTAWVSDTASSAAAVYVGQEERGGLDTYVYTVEVDRQPLVNPDVLASLPQSLPATTVAGLAAGLGLPDALRSQLDGLLAAVGPDVPLTYTYSSSSRLWVEPTSGVVVDTEKTEVRTAAIAATDTTPSVALTPVWDLTFAATDQTVTEAAADASDVMDTLRLYGTTIPIVLLVVGVLLLGGGALAARSGRVGDGPARVDALLREDARRVPQTSHRA